MTAYQDIQCAKFSTISKPIIIDDFVFIGIRSTILSGVELANGCVVASNSCATKSIKKYEVVGGVPAIKIGTRNRDLDYSIIYRPLFQ